MKLKALAAVVAATPLMVACGSAEKTSFTLNGAGATFPAPLYNSWFQTMAQETGNQVNYQAVGSGAGAVSYTHLTLPTKRIV